MSRADLWIPTPKIARPRQLRLRNGYERRWFVRLKNRPIQLKESVRVLPIQFRMRGTQSQKAACCII